MKKIILSLVITLTVCSVYAQRHVNMQVYGSYVRNLNPDFKGNGYGAGLRFEFYKEESLLSHYIGLHYTAPITTTKQIEARANDNWTEPSYVPVTATYKLPTYRIELGSRLYLAGEANEYKGFNFYLNGGVEGYVVTNKPTYSEYDKEVYSLGWSAGSDVNEDGTEKVGFGLMLAVGTGVEKNIGPGNLFLQAGLAFPAFTGTQDASDLASFAPIPVNVNFGYKISFGRNAK